MQLTYKTNTRQEFEFAEMKQTHSLTFTPDFTRKLVIFAYKHDWQEKLSKENVDLFSRFKKSLDIKTRIKWIQLLHGQK